MVVQRSISSGGLNSLAKVLREEVGRQLRQVSLSMTKVRRWKIGWISLGILEEVRLKN
jgi:hypothetical protein